MKKKSNNFNLAVAKDTLLLVDASKKVHQLRNKSLVKLDHFNTQMINQFKTQVPNEVFSQCKLISHYSVLNYYVQFFTSNDSNFISLHIQKTMEVIKTVKIQSKSVIFIQTFAIYDSQKAIEIIDFLTGKTFGISRSIIDNPISYILTD